MINMKTIKLLLAVLLTAVVCTQVAAQGFRNESFPEGSYSPVTNVNRAGCPRVLKDRSVMFRVNAPQAQQVQIDLCGTKYDMQKGEDGSWTVTTMPQVPGFHYYFLIVDGVSVADPASQSFYGCGRWSSAIEVKEDGCEDFEVQDVPRGEVRRQAIVRGRRTIPWCISSTAAVRIIAAGWNRDGRRRSWTT